MHINMLIFVHYCNIMTSKRWSKAEIIKVINPVVIGREFFSFMLKWRVKIIKV